MEHVCIQKEIWIQKFGSLLHFTEQKEKQAQHKGLIGKTLTVDSYPHKISIQTIEQIALLHFATYCTVNNIH